MGFKQAAVKSEVGAGSVRGGIRDLGRRLLLSDYFVLYLSIAYFLVLLPFVPGMASLNNLNNIFSNMWPLFVIAVGQTFVLLVAGIDLSQTSIMAVTSVIGAMIMTHGLDPYLFEKSPLWGTVLHQSGGLLGGSPVAAPVGILVMLLVGSLIGLFNGSAITRFRMPPFMVTLVTQMFFSAFAIWLTKTENVIHLPEGYNLFGQVLTGLVVAAMVGVVADLVLSRTVPGRWFYAVGTNIKASTVSGVPAARTIIMAYMISGFCAAAGAVLYSARLQQGRPTLGNNLLMDIVGAAVIGGASLSGGKGKVYWTLFGVLFFVLLSNSLNLLSLSFYTVQIVKGAVIVFAAALDVTRTRILAQR